MKCPKCGYLGFEPVERCRNCGYDFSMLQANDFSNLTIREREGRDETPLKDLALLDGAMSSRDPLVPRETTPEFPIEREGEVRRASKSTDLPLFGSARGEDQPLITKASPPRPPLAVRRATPETPRLRSLKARAPMLDLGADPGAAGRVTPSAGPHARTNEALDAGGGDAAGLLARVMATAIDLIILAAVDLLVVYFTMQICGLDFADLRILPITPLVAFLLVQNGGYLVVFTAGGQTLGKMAADIRVVPARSNSRLDLGHSMVRTLVWVVLAAPAGLGFLTTLVSRDRRGLHDRCAGTRVIRASA